MSRRLATRRRVPSVLLGWRGVAGRGNGASTLSCKTELVASLRLLLPREVRLWVDEKWMPITDCVVSIYANRLCTVLVCETAARRNKTSVAHKNWRKEPEVVLARLIKWIGDERARSSEITESAFES